MTPPSQHPNPLFIQSSGRLRNIPFAAPGAFLSSCSRGHRLWKLTPVAGRIFSYPVHLTWEFTSSHPIRSVFQLWPAYGLPMILLNWVWIEGGRGTAPPGVVYYTLRILMFVLSFVLEDWAIHELVHSPRHRRQAVVLVASSYVTWTFQTHTFSNSIETLLVLWSLVLIQRIVENRVCWAAPISITFADPELSNEPQSSRVQYSHSWSFSESSIGSPSRLLS